jgi:hypothetical protein
MSGGIKRKLLHRQWFHSHEEDTGNLMVFRPSSYRFPPSRGRKGYTFQPDGIYIESGPGPTDVPVSSKGTWRLKAHGVLALISPAGVQELLLRIISLEPDRLVVQKD